MVKHRFCGNLVITILTSDGIFTIGALRTSGKTKKTRKHYDVLSKTKKLKKMFIWEVLPYITT